MTDDGLPCSRCPILDLGTVYPVRDERDPFRRMPRIFAIARGVLGPGMYKHDSRARTTLEMRLGHYCRRMREMHGPCNGARIGVCEDALAHTIQEAAFCDKGQEWARLQAGITRLVGDERHHAALKRTETSAAAPDLRMPPISLRPVPDV